MGFGKFLVRNYRRISKVKTILNSSTPSSLESIFEAPNLLLDDQIITEQRLVERLQEVRFIVITGNGGCGKSIFLRHLFVRYYIEALNKIPIFIELRNISRGSTIFDYTRNILSEISPHFTEDLFEYSMATGRYIILLDGFDEVAADLRKDMATEILSIAYKYGDNQIVVSSRPDDIFNSWNEFYVAKIQPFNKKQVLSLIQKLRYDKKIKAKFKEIVQQGLFATHKEYLSNPLLCLIMLITFEQGADIPRKMSVFFGSAFNALFFRHDATKETGFRRKFMTDITIDEFRSLLAVFATLTYFEYGASFGVVAAHHVARNAIQYDEISVAEGAFIHDITTSLSIVVKDGDIYSFIHRSFQEYFVAYFLAFREFDEWEQFVFSVITEHPNDTVIKLLRELNSDRFDRQFLLPRLRNCVDKLKTIELSSDPYFIYFI